MIHHPRALSPIDPVVENHQEITDLLEQVVTKKDLDAFKAELVAEIKRELLPALRPPSPARPRTLLDKLRRRTPDEPDSGEAPPAKKARI